MPAGFPFEDCFRRLWDHYGEPGAWELYADVEPALERLGRVVRLGVISNFDARLWPVLRGHGLLDCFEVVVPSSAVGVVKPRPGIFEAACRQAGVEASDCLHVGDDPERDWAGARAAGMSVWELRRPGHGLLELAAHVESGWPRVPR
jgi:putative hydrolase of the HAD superfamily